MIALIVATINAKLLSLPVETIGSRFQEISSVIPIPLFPEFSIATINKLFVPVMTIAILAALESLLSAVVADGMIMAMFLFVKRVSDTTQIRDLESS